MMTKSYVSFGLLLQVLLAMPARVVAQNTTTVACEGEVLASKSLGCTTADACRSAAEAMGLQIGDATYGFEGDWSPKGCVYYQQANSNQAVAYFGTQGTCDQLDDAPDDGAIRLDCAGDTPTKPIVDGDTDAGVDTTDSGVGATATECEDSVCMSMEDCQSAAQAMGLELGSLTFPFAGDWDVKGCTYFPASDLNYGNQAYWGSGASSCDELSTMSPSDGSQRLGCGLGDNSEESTGQAPALEPTQAPQEGEDKDQDKPDKDADDEDKDTNEDGLGELNEGKNDKDADEEDEDEASIVNGTEVVFGTNTDKGISAFEGGEVVSLATTTRNRYANYLIVFVSAVSMIFL